MNTYNYQTHSRTILGDLHTPVSTYLKVRDVFPQSALMESSDYHGSESDSVHWQASASTMEQPSSACPTALAKNAPSHRNIL